MNQDQTPLQRLKTAWEIAPHGTKAKLSPMHSRQKIHRILENGLKDETIIEQIIDDVKKVANEIVKEIVEANEKLQNL